MAEYIEREATLECVKAYGKRAIDEGRKELDTVDDVILLVSAVECLPAVNVAPVEEIEQLKRERDAAVADIFNFSSIKCFCCAHNTHKWLSDRGMDDLCRTCLENDKCNWKWRGVRKEK